MPDGLVRRAQGQDEEADQLGGTVAEHDPLGRETVGLGERPLEAVLDRVGSDGRVAERALYVHGGSPDALVGVQPQA